MADFKLTFGNGEDFTLKKGEIKKGIEKTDFENEAYQNIFDKLLDKNSDGRVSKREAKSLFRKLKKAAKLDGEKKNLSEAEAQILLKKFDLEDVTTRDLLGFIKEVKELSAGDSAEKPSKYKKPEGEEDAVKPEGEEAAKKPEGEEVVVKPEGEEAAKKPEGEEVVVKLEGEEAAKKSEGEVKPEGAENEEGAKPSENKGKVFAKNGETFNQTAKRLGFEEGTPEYEEFVKANPEAAQKNWFYLHKEINIPESLQDKLSEDAYKVDTNEEQAKWQEAIGRKPVKRNTPVAPVVDNGADGADGAGGTGDADGADGANGAAGAKPPKKGEGAADKDKEKVPPKDGEITKENCRKTYMSGVYYNEKTKTHYVEKDGKMIEYIPSFIGEYEKVFQVNKDGSLWTVKRNSDGTKTRCLYDKNGHWLQMKFSDGRTIANKYTDKGFKRTYYINGKPIDTTVYDKNNNIISYRSHKLKYTDTKISISDGSKITKRKYDNGKVEYSREINGEFVLCDRYGNQIKKTK